MPSVVGPIKINNVSSGAVVQMGDCLYIAPKVATKTIAGSGDSIREILSLPTMASI